ncbi:MAG: hypothetical protein IJ334_17525 [Clostridia bacterium]|nr:hypothetical protein [Clostridia bacterium]
MQEQPPALPPIPLRFHLRQHIRLFLLGAFPRTSADVSPIILYIIFI